MPSYFKVRGCWAATLLPVLLFSGAVVAADGAAIAAKGGAGGATACVSCHGQQGEGVAAAGFPRLAGLAPAYLSAQLQAFRSGARNNPVMAPIAKALDPDESTAVTAYYGQLPPPATTSVAAPSDAAGLAVGKALARYGDWVGRGLPACEQCHAPDGRGVGADFPALAGQGALYITNQLKAFAQGQRKGDALGLMPTVAVKLSADEITAVAAWYAALSAAGPVPEALQAMVAAEFAGSRDAAAKATGGFRSPPRSAYPDGAFGDAVRRGEAMFIDTNRHTASAGYVGNDQQCANCHLAEGRLAGSTPMWAAWVAYPAYRSKNNKVNTFLDRLQGCFTYSMNAQASAKGQAPSLDSPVLADLSSYAFWLANGAPTGDAGMPGRGFPKLAETADGFDPQRGATVFAERCAQCHGSDGQGAKSGNDVVFPPLWGPRAYNWGAGMHSINKAARFIKANMPLGLSNSLSDQQAWDVAAYINSFDRPQDPRFTGDLAETMQKFHHGRFDYYGKRRGADGRLLGSQSPGVAVQPVQ